MVWPASTLGWRTHRRRPATHGGVPMDARLSTAAATSPPSTSSGCAGTPRAALCPRGRAARAALRRISVTCCRASPGGAPTPTRRFPRPTASRSSRASPHGQGLVLGRAIRTPRWRRDVELSRRDVEDRGHRATRLRGTMEPCHDLDYDHSELLHGDPDDGSPIPRRASSTISSARRSTRTARWSTRPAKSPLFIMALLKTTAP